MKFRSDRQRRAMFAKMGMGKQSHRQIWTGDWDGDNIPNIDDTKPFKYSGQYVNDEAKLSKAWNGLVKRREEYEPGIKDIMQMVGAKSGRIKEEYSTINKQMTRYIDKVRDMGGVRVVVPTHLDVVNRAAELYNQLKNTPGIEVKEFENVYDRSLRDPEAPYMAIHIGIEYKKKPYEIQVMTKTMDRISKKIHEAYKTNDTATLREMRLEVNKLMEEGLV